MGIKIIFITGGARSGKSSFAIKEASTLEGQKAYIATAESLDDEMKERILNHKKDRGTDWDTYEEPVAISNVLPKLSGKYNAIILDCLTLWLSNILQKKMDIKIEIANFLSNLKGFKETEKRRNGETEKSPRRRFTNPPCHVFIVSNEVGMGLVPDNELARKFRDLAGMLNQKVAEIADEVYLATAGIPMKIK